jgi:hypothetical protein
MKLNETVEMMASEDFKERFKAEYYQLQIRIDGLHSMLVKYKKGNLPFVPKCSYDLLKAQLMSMEMYLEFLEERAKIESIDI